MNDAHRGGVPAGWVLLSTLRRERADEPEVDLAADDLAQIVYTSGTESLPKGAMLTHAALLWQYAAILVEAGVARDDTILHGPAAVRDVRPGEVGEIVHRSPQLLQGYYRDEARTAEAFAGGWFHSGDLATVDAARSSSAACATSTPRCIACPARP